MFEVYIYSRITGQWGLVQKCGTVGTAWTIANRYTSGYHANDPYWVQIRRGGETVFDSIKNTCPTVAA